MSASPGDPDGLTVLDFNGLMATIILDTGSSLTLKNLALRGYASPDYVNASTWPYYQNFAFLAWPSMVVFPNVRVSLSLSLERVPAQALYIAHVAQLVNCYNPPKRLVIFCFSHIRAWRTIQ